MKAKYILVSLLLVALVMGGAGYGVAADSGVKITGGGKFENNGFPNPYANLGDKISFGFNVQDQGNDAKGQIHLVNNTLKTRVSGTVSEILSSTQTSVNFEGTLRDGTGFEAWVSKDSVIINIGGQPAFKSLLGSFNGNIQVHKQ